MWAPLKILAPVGGAQSILEGIPATLGLIQIDPWTFGVGEGRGAARYLSFPNAVRAAIRRLPPEYDGALLAVGIATRGLNSLGGSLGELSAAFPLPSFGAMARRVERLATLEVDKFNLPLGLPPGLSTVLPGGLPSLKAVQQAAIREASQAAVDALGDAWDALSDLAAQKSAHQAELSGAMAGATAALSGEPSNCWRCYAEADHAAALLAGMPGHEHTLSSVAVFIGQPAELNTLKGILNAVA